MHPDLDQEVEEGTGPREVRNYTPHPAYAELDDGVKASVSEKQFAWMPDSQRTRFLSTLGEPDSFPDA